MISSKSSPKPKAKESGNPELLTKGKRKKVNSELLGFDLLYVLAYMAAISTGGATRGRFFQAAGDLPVSAAQYFEDVERLAQSMNYQYAEACRIVGEYAEHEEVKGLLLRLSSSLSTGEKESDFMMAEAKIQAEAYGNVYERQLETLKKWTDAFSALIVSASLIIVVATVSTMIYDLGVAVVSGLIFAMIGISGLGVWIIYRGAPREIKTLDGEQGAPSQRLPRKLFMLLVPGMFTVCSLMTLLEAPVWMTTLTAAGMCLPIGLAAKRFDKRVTNMDKDVSTFLRVLGTTVTAIGTTPVVAMARMDLRAMRSLAPGIKRLRTRMVARVSPEVAWGRFVTETGSELVSRSARIFMDGVKMGGDAEDVGLRASVMTSKVTYLRDKRRLVAGSFTYLSLAMHATIVFLLIFVVEIVNGFNGLISAATVTESVEGGVGNGNMGAAAGAAAEMFSFNTENLQLLRTMLTPVVLVLSVVNAVAPKVTEGGYIYTVFYYLGLTLLASGIAFWVAPLLAGMIFGVAD